MGNVNAVKRVSGVDPSVFALFEVKGWTDAGPEIERGIVDGAFGPTADSPTARRLQVFLACAAEGGMPSIDFLALMLKWATRFNDRIRRGSPRSKANQKYHSGLVFALDYALAVVESRVYDEDQIQSEELAESASDWDYDEHPIACIAWNLLLLARKIHRGESMTLEAAWGYTAAMLGGIALAMNPEQFEEEAQNCTRDAYTAIFGVENYYRAAMANVNAGTRRTDRANKPKTRSARKERRHG